MSWDTRKELGCFLTLFKIVTFCRPPASPRLGERVPLENLCSCPSKYPILWPPQPRTQTVPKTFGPSPAPFLGKALSRSPLYAIIYEI